MWTQVESVIEDLKPLVGSIGLDLRVDDVIDQVVTIEVLRVDPHSRPDMARLREFVTREVRDLLPEITEVRFIGDAAVVPAVAGVQLTYTPPEPDADTLVVRVSQPVGPAATTSFDDAGAASDWPAVRAVLGIAGVVSVVVRDRLLILARDEAATWEPILDALQGTIAAALGSDAPPPEGSVRDRVQQILDRDINPALSAHGGFIEVLDLRDGDLFIHMGGGCQGCAQSQATLRLGVERQLKQQVPEIRNIYDKTDHAAGQNPYFSG